MKWWREARFGMFIHYNMFSQWMDPQYKWLEEHPEANTPEDHDRLRVEKLRPDKDAVRNWIKTAHAGGMKYAVLTTKHNCGFPLWNSKVNPFCAVNYGPKRDLVAEFVKACREFGLKVGFYYALNDRHTGIKEQARTDEKYRQEILKYTKGLLRELMTQYGEVSILWYDEPSPMGYGGEWDSAEINAMVRKHQPGIIINDRSLTYQDFTCSEGHITSTAYPDQDWECCMTFNGTWAWHPTPKSKYYTPRGILDLLATVCNMGGNVLLNSGPEPYSGQIRDIEVERLATVGKWLKVNGEAVYGTNERAEALGQLTVPTGAKWTKHGTTGYLWLFKWPGKSTITIDKVHTKLLKCSLLTTKKPLKFTQEGEKIVISGLPKGCPDKICQCAVIKMEFAAYPR
ncbi:MAG: alpha-L-fucosidase [Planctomycetaceae bacterium]